MSRLRWKAGAAAMFLAAAGGAAGLLAQDPGSDSPKPTEVSSPAEYFADSPVYHVVSDQQLIGGEAAPACAAVSDGCDIDMCDCCPPNWYVSAGVVVLNRSTPSAGTIVAANPAGTEFSGGDDFDFGWDVGVDFTVARRLRNGDILEVRYLGIDSDADLEFVTPGNFIGAGFTGPTGTSFVGDYMTQLDSTEINWRRPWSDRLTFLAGFRWIELKDELSYNLNSGVAVGQYEYNNHLYGGQVGADWAIIDQYDPLQVNLVGKAGYYGNFADGGIQEFAGGNPIGGFGSSDTFSAFVGELGISASYRLTDCMAVRAGYQLLWIENVALASNAASFSLLNPSLLNANVETDGLFYHGATAGIELVW
jgi:hypothetical protein